MGLSSVLDTNIALYKLHSELAEALPLHDVFVSLIPENVLLGFSGLTPSKEADIRAMLASLTVVPLDDRVKDEAIRLRRTLRLRLPNAIVLATAVVTGSELLTNDRDLGAKATVPYRSLAMKSRT